MRNLLHILGKIGYGLFSASIAFILTTVFALASCTPAIPPTVIHTFCDLQNIQNNLSGNYVLGNSISAAGLEFAPIGNEDTPFQGSFDGNGFVIRSITITSPSKDVGLFGANNGLIKNVELSGININIDTSTLSYSILGGIIGFNTGTLENSYVSGSLESNVNSSVNYLGGVVGYNNGTIENTRSLASVTVIGNSTDGNLAYIGGIVGESGGTIKLSSSSGRVNAGRLAYSQSLAFVGGLAGESGGMLSEDFATGAVIAGSNAATGGLTGSLGGRSSYISQSYATGAVIAGAGAKVGGLVGWNDDGVVSESFATGNVLGGKNSNVGGLAGQNAWTCDGAGCGYPARINYSYSTGRVTGGENSIIGGLIGFNSVTGNIGYATDSYWDVAKSGIAVSAAGTGLTTDQLKATLPIGFAASVWEVYPDHSIYPSLRWQAFLAGFPLKTPTLQWLTPFTAEIITVVDHSGTPLDPDPAKRHPWYSRDNIVTAYNGETGSFDFGENCPPAPGYRNKAHTNFILNGHYVGSGGGANCNQTPKAYLNYDGHPGFDYVACPNGICGRIYAPKSGVLKKAKIDNVNHSQKCGTINGWDEWHSFYIDHGSGYYTWYLHASKLLVAEGPVLQGQQIAVAGGFGDTESQCGVQGAFPPHLHFEVRKGPVELQAVGVQDQVVDPYSDALWLH